MTAYLSVRNRNACSVNIAYNGEVSKFIIGVKAAVNVKQTLRTR